MHPGGPFWATKDLGAWSIPKGEYDESEEPLQAAIREFREETSFCASAPFHELGSVKQPGGKMEELLFGPTAGPETSFEYAFQYPDAYPAKWYYSGRNRFERHFYPVVGELESTGEECDCAEARDAQSRIRTWVRNLAIQPEFSFWLQTSTDRFYPDFVAELLDGRLLVVEYKGKDYASNDDSR